MEACQGWVPENASGPVVGGVFVAGEVGKVQFDKDLAQLVEMLDL